ncbi:uncharacterized protein LOC132309663 [Cornus florida]|uniref:uncharacterized protein LOC132309663 n=1 Tax=Cornus florida TaxID=4283 RepID=UPI00289DBDC0|nr:uncharacterized protein LOC132309663 [Cornus florida]
MKWLIRRYGHYWPGIRKDCITYAKGCTDCQKHGPMQWILAIEMQLLVKPWPFRDWAMDLIGKINPPSSKGHHWIILATDYFTKRVEAEEYVSVTREVLQLGCDMQVKIVTSTPYYAQGNGQAEASNKVVIEIIEKMIKDKPRCWHGTFLEAVWSYRNSKRTSTGITPYRLTFGHDAMLPMELNVKSTKVMKAYDKRVKFKSFAEGDMVWQTILPPGKVDRTYGKWLPTWNGPYIVHQVLHGGAYKLKDLDGEVHERSINRRYLKKYQPIIFELFDEKKASNKSNIEGECLA